MISESILSESVNIEFIILFTSATETYEICDVPSSIEGSQTSMSLSNEEWFHFIGQQKLSKKRGWLSS